jgi:threonine/homoserine/homoserine lactone efflux protein
LQKYLIFYDFCNHKLLNPQHNCAMTYQLLSALAAFAFVTSITPGPNNLMLMTSGVNFGFRRTIPHMLGVGLGFVFMLVLVGAGLIEVFDRYPVSYTALKIFSVAYLVYLAWKIATAGAPDTKGSSAKPITFVQAALFQWVNPKAWAMALTAISAYAPSKGLGAIVLVGLVFGAVNLPSVGSWTILGQQMRRVLTNPRRLRLFNIIMAVLLLASLYPVLIP